MKRFLVAVALTLALLLSTAVPAKAIGLHGYCVKGEVKMHYATAGLPPAWLTYTTNYIPVAPPTDTLLVVPDGGWATWLAYQFWVDYNIQLPDGTRYGFRWTGVNVGRSPTHTESRLVSGQWHTCSWWGETFSTYWDVGNMRLVGDLHIETST